MKNVIANLDEHITAPYTLEKLMKHLDHLQDAPFQRFLKANLNDLQRLNAHDKLLAYRIDIIRKELMKPAILEDISWEHVVRRFSWTKPYYLWIKCLAAGKNNHECQLPDHFLNWQDDIPGKNFKRYSR